MRNKQLQNALTVTAAQKGASLMECTIVLALIALIALTALPRVGQSISQQAVMIGELLAPGAVVDEEEGEGAEGGNGGSGCPRGHICN